MIAGIFSAGYLVGLKNYRFEAYSYPEVSIDRGLPSDKSELDFDLFWKVWDTLETKYFDNTQLIPAKMVYGAIQGMVGAVGDPYTVFLPPKDNKVIQEDLKGSFEGVGIQIGFKGVQLAVIAPLHDSPAERAGVLAGDLIVGIRDVKKEIDMGTAGITLPDAVQAIRGPAGSTVTLLILRNGSEEIFEVDIVRESIEVPSIVLEYVGDPSEDSGQVPSEDLGQANIAHIRILKFVGETTTEWEKVVISVLKRRDVEGIIIDVRNNPGGYLQAAVELASDFLEIGEVVVSEQTANGDIKEFKVEKIGRLRNRDVVLLVNKGSASASEILAGALRDVANIQIIGETTFGKGTIQEPQQINGGAGLHITIAKWLTPSGFWVNEGGLVPDIEIKNDVETEEDEQLQEAINYLRSN